MEDIVINALKTQWPLAILLWAGWRFFTKYFMGVIDKKDQQNQANLERFIVLTEKAIWVMADINWLKPKLDEMHEDIRNFIKK